MLHSSWRTSKGGRGSGGWWYNKEPTYQGWIPEFNHTLGVPVGDASLSKGGEVYSRSFSTGTVVSFNTKTNRGHFEWGHGTGVMGFAGRA